MALRIISYHWRASIFFADASVGQGWNLSRWRLLENVGRRGLLEFDFDPIVILIRGAFNIYRRNDESTVCGELELLHQIRISFCEFGGTRSSIGAQSAAQVIHTFLNVRGQSRRILK